MIPQLGVLGTKAQDFVISSRLGEGEKIPQLHLRALHIIGEILLLQDKIGQINNLTGKYIMELSKLKQLKRYMILFELDYIKFEGLPKIHQLYTIFNSTIE